MYSWVYFFIPCLDILVHFCTSNILLFDLILTILQSPFIQFFYIKRASFFSHACVPFSHMRMFMSYTLANQISRFQSYTCVPVLVIPVWPLFLQIGYLFLVMYLCPPFRFASITHVFTVWTSHFQSCTCVPFQTCQCVPCFYKQDIPLLVMHVCPPFRYAGVSLVFTN